MKVLVYELVNSLINTRSINFISLPVEILDGASGSGI